MLKEKIEYQKYVDLRNLNQHKVSVIASYRMIAFLIMLFSYVLKHYYYPIVFQFLFILGLISFIFFIIIHNRYYKLYDYYEKYVEILEEYLKREDGSWKSFSDTGFDFCQDDNLFLRDLDVLGERSLFQFLSVCKTNGGRVKLFQRLSNKESKISNLKEEQDGILELSNQFHFCVDFQVYMDIYRGKNLNLSEMFSSFQVKKDGKKRDLCIALIIGFLCILLFVLSLFQIISIRYFYGMFLFNYMISIMYSYIYKDEFTSITKLLSSYGKLLNIIELISHQSFSSKKLKMMKQNMINSKGDYLELKKIDILNSLKDNFLSGLLFNGFFCINIILLYSFTKFLERTFGKLWISILDIEELEAMISLAGVGVLREDFCMPVLEKEIGISFQEIKHPLLSESICVSNDFEVNNGVQVITGSNMGGKTSFLRTIGINLILMNAGTFVCAKSFQASYFKIFTSMRVVDDIEKGISTFYGELLRIGEAMSYLNKGNMIVFIDEIFKGTNYQDRIYGAKKVIEKLNTDNTLVFLTTHDFELCEIKGVSNYHVQEDYDGDKILFDYKIRKGKCSSTNAKYLMKRLGIIDK